MQIKSLLAGAVLALSANTVSAKGFSCAAPQPSAEQLDDARAFFSALKAGGAQPRARAAFTVNTYVHVVGASTAKYISVSHQTPAYFEHNSIYVTLLVRNKT